jgi:hypothetical protein
MTQFDAGTARRRYLLLTALRWLPVGLMMPIFVLVPLGRGLTLTEIGVVFAAQGLVVLALELPTGGPHPMPWDGGPSCCSHRSSRSSR